MLAFLLIIPLSFILVLIVIGHLLNKQGLPSLQADAALVFGTGLGWKAKARWTHAAQLYHQRLARYVIVSGGVPVPGFSQTEAEWFRNNLINLRIPREQILIENRATNALENVSFALPIIQRYKFKTIILVMSDFTGLRAHLTAQQAWSGETILRFSTRTPRLAHIGTHGHGGSPKKVGT